MSRLTSPDFARSSDAVLFDGPIRKAVSVEAYKANLRAILEQVPKQVPRLLFTPPIPQPSKISIFFTNEIERCVELC